MNDTATIFKSYAKDVYGLSYYYLKNQDDSDDVTMEAFEAFIKKSKQELIKNPRAWLLETAKRKCLQLIRKHIRSRDHENALMHQNIFMESDQKEHLLEEKKVDLLLEAVNSLKGGQRDCVRLFYLTNASYDDIAGKLSLDTKSVKSHIQNGKRNLKIVLEKELQRIDNQT